MSVRVLGEQPPDSWPRLRHAATSRRARAAAEVCHPDTEEIRAEARCLEARTDAPDSDHSCPYCPQPPADAAPPTDTVPRPGPRRWPTGGHGRRRQPVEAPVPPARGDEPRGTSPEVPLEVPPTVVPAEIPGMRC